LAFSAYNEEHHLTLIEECKKVGMRVVGLDTRSSYRSQAFIDFSDNYFLTRTKAMNALAVAIIEKEKRGNFTNYAGIGHLKENTIEKFPSRIKEAVPGICAILKIPTAYVMDIGEADYHMGDKPFYIASESQLSGFEAQLQHTLIARAESEKVLDDLDYYIKNDPDFVQEVFKPSLERFDLKIEAHPSTDFHAKRLFPQPKIY
jgi:hypothetical protein